METTVAPKQISPLIKGARWGLLFAGVIYGSSRYSVLYKRNQVRLAELERTRPEREAKAKAERDRIAQKHLDELMSSIGTKF